MKKTIFLSLALTGLIAGMALAQEKAPQPPADDEKVTTTPNKITGQISDISKKSFSVVYKKDEATGGEFEMLFPIDKNLRVVHKKSLSEMKVGDTVEVQYEDVTTEKKDRKEGKRNTAVITFISPGEEQPAEPVHDTNPAVANNDESATVAPLKSDLR